MFCSFRGLLSLSPRPRGSPTLQARKELGTRSPLKASPGSRSCMPKWSHDFLSWLGASEESGDSHKGWCLGWVSSDQRSGGRRGGEEQDGQRKQQQQRLPGGQHSLESGTASGLAFFILLQPGGDLYHARELPPPSLSFLQGSLHCRKKLYFRSDTTSGLTAALLGLLYTLLGFFPPQLVLLGSCVCCPFSDIL